MLTNKLSQRMPRAVNSLALAFAALVTGSRTIPMGDNGALLRDLAARVARTSATCDAAGARGAASSDAASSNARSSTAARHRRHLTNR